MDIPEIVREKFAKAVEFDGEIRNDHSLSADLGLNSMDFIDLVMDLELEFDIEISDKIWDEVRTGAVGDVICVVQDAIAGT